MALSLFSSTAPPRRVAAAAWAAGALLGAVFLTGASSAGSGPNLKKAVQVDGQAVPEHFVLQAANVCRKSIDELELSTCIERYWVPRFLLDAEARADALRKQPRMAHEIADLLARSLAERIHRAQIEPSDEELEAYIAEHRRDFEKPLRIRIYRILVDTKEDAEELRKDIGDSVTVARFRTLARERSLDHATHERGGDLGFVWPNGSTDIPQVSAETALYQAALSLEDGELAIVPEGKRFAVLFRAGSLAPLELDEEGRTRARRRLREARAEAELQSLIASALQESVTGRDDVLLGKLRRQDASLFSTR